MAGLPQLDTSFPGPDCQGRQVTAVESRGQCRDRVMHVAAWCQARAADFPWDSGAHAVALTWLCLEALACKCKGSGAIG